jgi:uncharacterized membrane protein YhaH (DUF805 family)
MQGVMEDLFEFLFGSSGRINRAQYWRSLVICSIAALLGIVIVLTGAGLGVPLFLMAAIVFIPWLLWGFAISTERLHDRRKSAWWLLLFYLLPAGLSQFAEVLGFAGAAGTVLQYALALAAFALTIWGFVEIGLLRGTAGPNKYGPDPLARAKRRG